MMNLGKLLSFIERVYDMQWLIWFIWFLILWEGNLLKQSFQLLNLQLPDQFFIIISDCLLYFFVLPPAVRWQLKTVCDPTAVPYKDDWVGRVECKMVQPCLLPMNYRLYTYGEHAPGMTFNVKFPGVFLKKCLVWSLWGCSILVRFTWGLFLWFKHGFQIKQCTNKLSRGVWKSA